MSIQVHTSTVGGTGREISQAPVSGTSSKNANRADQLEAGHGDTVSLSGITNLIGSNKAEISPERQAKIESLSAQVRSGQYKVDSGDVSRALMQDMLAG
jgi:flagellar biosynthesis anti-sigma factor FlgM